MEPVIYKKFHVRIQLKSPMHIHSGSVESGYRSVLKIKKSPVVPGTTIKGKMRDNFSRLLPDKDAAAHKNDGYCRCPSCIIFGGSGYQPAYIIVDDFVLESGEPEQKAPDLRVNIAMDRYRRVAKDKALVTTEVVEKGVFSGNVEVYLTEETKKYINLLKTALLMIENIGGSKSRGLGFVKVEVMEIE